MGAVHEKKTDMKGHLKLDVVPYEEGLRKRLQDTRYASKYLKACLEDNESPAVFLVALRDVAEAWGMAEIAQKTKVTRSALYKMLSDKGNPGFRNVMALVNRLGMTLTIQPKSRTSKKTAPSRRALKRVASR
jgi:probable addiction module antidote protein